MQNRRDDHKEKDGSNGQASAGPIARLAIAELDGILGKSFRLLDDGFVRLVDYMGGDAAVVQAARVSYGAGTKHVQDDRALIRYLMRHSHTTPFEMCEIKLHVRVPMDTWRQWIRHRTANVNEYSTRYSVAIDAAQRTSPGAWRRQSQENKQGSAGYLPHDVGAELTKSEAELQNMARAIYEERIATGVAREQARKDLPLSTYTEAYWKIDLHNLLNFLQLRMDDHAQEEIRTYAMIIGQEVVAKWVPLVWEAFLDYRKNSVILSKAEARIITLLISGNRDAARDAAREFGLLNRTSSGELRSSRERKELERKLALFGLSPFWK
jgi:thymidylate synthase (FAD)